MQKKDIESIIRIVPSKVLIMLLNNGNHVLNYRKIAKKEDIAYAWLIKLSKKLKKMNLIKDEKIGRKRIVELTDKGRKVALSLNKIYNLLEK